jgi:thymidylate kinase
MHTQRVPFLVACIDLKHRVVQDSQQLNVHRGGQVENGQCCLSYPLVVARLRSCRFTRGRHLPKVTGALWDVATGCPCCTACMTWVLAVDGVAPGVGKSTLVDALSAALSRRGVAVLRFDEADVLTHDSFAELAREFADTGRVGPQTFLRATERYLRWLDQTATDSNSVAVVDALFPFIPSLYGWGYGEDEIDAFLEHLRNLPGTKAITFVYLDDDPRIALDRAIAREHDVWLPWLLSTLSTATGGAPTDLDSLCDYLSNRRELTLRLLPRHHWRILRVADATRRATDDITADVFACVGRIIDVPAGCEPGI